MNDLIKKLQAAIEITLNSKPSFRERKYFAEGIFHGELYESDIDSHYYDIECLTVALSEAEDKVKIAHTLIAQNVTSDDMTLEHANRVAPCDINDEFYFSAAEILEQVEALRGGTRADGESNEPQIERLLKMVAAS